MRDAVGSTLPYCPYMGRTSQGFHVSIRMAARTHHYVHIFQEVLEMSRNLTCAVVIAAGLLSGMKAMAADPAPAPTVAAAAKPADKLSRVLGGIRDVDTKAKTITLGGFGGGEQTVTYNDDTKYMLDIPAVVSDINVGDTLRAITLAGGNDAATTSISPDFLNIVPTVEWALAA